MRWWCEWGVVVVVFSFRWPKVVYGLDFHSGFFAEFPQKTVNLGPMSWLFHIHWPSYVHLYVRCTGSVYDIGFFFRTRPVRFDRYSSPNGINEMVKNWVEQIEGALKCSFFPIILDHQGAHYWKPFADLGCSPLQEVAKVYPAREKTKYKWPKNNIFGKWSVDNGAFSVCDIYTLTFFVSSFCYLLTQTETETSEQTSQQTNNHSTRKRENNNTEKKGESNVVKQQ